MPLTQYVGDPNLIQLQLLLFPEKKKKEFFKALFNLTELQKRQL